MAVNANATGNDGDWEGASENVSQDTKLKKEYCQFYYLCAGNNCLASLSKEDVEDFGLLFIFRSVFIVLFAREGHEMRQTNKVVRPKFNIQSAHYFYLIRSFLHTHFIYHRSLFRILNKINCGNWGKIQKKKESTTFENSSGFRIGCLVIVFEVKYLSVFMVFHGVCMCMYMCVNCGRILSSVSFPPSLASE